MRVFASSRGVAKNAKSSIFLHNMQLKKSFKTVQKMIRVDLHVFAQLVHIAWLHNCSHWSINHDHPLAPMGRRVAGLHPSSLRVEADYILDQSALYCRTIWRKTTIHVFVRLQTCPALWESLQQTSHKAQGSNMLTPHRKCQCISFLLKGNANHCGATLQPR